MFYADTSAIVKLYFKETLSLEVSNWIRRNNEAIPLTLFHELEFKNALQLKRFRSEVTSGVATSVASRLQEHLDIGIYYRPSINWINVFRLANELSQKHTSKIGARSLDIIHLASALILRAERLLSLDQRQIKLADSVGLNVIRLANT